MLQILDPLTSSGVIIKVTLLPVRSCGIQSGHSERLQSLSSKMKGQVELCTKICTIATALHQVHSGEERGVYRRIFTLNTHHIYIKLHITSPTSLHLKDSYDL